MCDKRNINSNASSLISLTQYTEPVFTAVASFFILGEHLFGMGWWGAALLLACIVYGNYIERKVEAILQTGSAVINSNLL